MQISQIPQTSQNPSTTPNPQTSKWLAIRASADNPILSDDEALDIAAYINTGFVRMPMHTTEGRAGIDTAYSKSPSLKPDYFASPQQNLDPKEFIKVKYGPWKNPNYFPGE